jgi:hypothetical protein
MKKIHILVLVLASLSFAGGLHIVRSHYIALGLDATFTQGDMDGKGYVETNDDEDAKERVYIPNLSSFFIPNIEIGANMNQHTIAVSFGMWNPSVGYAEDDSSLATEKEANYWRASVEYRYNFFWPEKFQLALGLAYSFARLEVNGSVIGHDEYGSEKIGNAVHSGNGIAPSFTMHYLITDNIGIDIALRYRLLSFGSVSTPDNGFCALDKSLYQHFGELGMKLFYQF